MATEADRYDKAYLNGDRDAREGRDQDPEQLNGDHGQRQGYRDGYSDGKNTPSPPYRIT